VTEKCEAEWSVVGDAVQPVWSAPQRASTESQSSPSHITFALVLVDVAGFRVGI
jgi:hypothetical protein